ncbi:response regulator [Marinobacter nanhaiticus D15-8W]|uniref:Response regulator n=1 Tax=Marinobacter nanhaiticus D15-8W TaxID=626887 RepID=N6W3F7_9GAMM|nr:response regulator [Marinobacter nanhaiticus]ENO17080.1 response regulator [Marinobacter nanhaiticus D15-8W]BES71924.1 response regulator [Marinobacter nanhaiticus D15-8W]
MSFRILICDDSSMARKQMARALPKNWSADITYAEDGEKALAIIRQGECDLMFLDLNMPVLDGYGVLEAVARDDLPVMTIVVSGDIQPQARERVRKLGAMDFIRKPTDPDKIQQILEDFGLYRSDELDGEDLAPSVAEQDVKLDLTAYLQEMSNVAMGQAADLLARLLDVFVKLPVPRVATLAQSELSMALTAVSSGESYSAVCQGFNGAGVAGEALLLFSDASFDDMAHLLRYEEENRNALEVEVLMDMSSILFGAFLKGLGDQLDLRFGLSHPTVLGQHRQVSELLEYHQDGDQQLLCIEINYAIEDHNVVCDLLILLTADSRPHLEKAIAYLTE